MLRPADTSQTHVLLLSEDAGLRRRFMVVEEPLQGNLRFGLLLEVLDKLAEETSLAYVRRFDPDARVVTAAIDKIVVRHAPDVTRDIRFLARINHVGRSSMEVGIRVEHPDPIVHIASCYFTMVARSTAGGEEKSLVIQPLECADDLERRRAQKALEKREAYRREVAALREPPTHEEWEMLARLHRTQEEPGFQGRLAASLVTEAWERMYPENENVPRKIFGGYLIRRAYALSSICAERITPNRPLIAAVNRINFFHPVRIGDTLHFTSRVVYTGRCSVTVEASIERTSRDRTTKALSNSCLFTFANVDRDLARLPVPQVYPVTYAEDARWIEAYRNNRALAHDHPFLSE